MNTFDLNSQPKIKSGFNVPEDYFDALPQQVLQKLETTPVIPLHRKRRNLIMAAAAVLLLALLVPVYNSFNPTTELDDATLESYLAYHSGLTQFDLLQEMAPEDIAQMEITLPVEDEVIEEVLSANADFEQLLIE
ncbi:MAG TPA: hypothetical protein VF676_00740 [Flavobacterium sp.]|jgi:hypothetical protein